ncbi:MAG: helix-turn-helix domain-containing protein, partial [Terriglobia bacterium]
RYLTRYRIQRAKKLIMYSNDALKEIAEASGFKSIHHFSHLFFEMTGETPGAWRRRYQEGICRDFCINPHFSNVVWIAREEDESVNFR